MLSTKSLVTTQIITILLIVNEIFAQFAGGTGTESDPYLISTPEHLNNIRYCSAPSQNWKFFKLLNDIDLTAYLAPGGAGYAAWGESGWLPLENDAGYTYKDFDGANHTITGLKINRETSNNVGLFKGNISIKNLSVIVDPSSFVQGQDYVGIIAGDTYVINCHSAGIVRGRRWVGGLIGYGFFNNSSSSADVSGTQYNIGGLAGSGEGENCYAFGNVTGSSGVGGLVGSSEGQISKCYASGTVNGTASVGGLVGLVFRGYIKNSYAASKVTGQNYVGGLVGLNTGYQDNGGKIANCYAIGVVNGATDAGGLVGFNNNNAYVINSYWDKQSTGQTTSAYSDSTFGKTTIEMKNQSTFIDWDFDSVWSINPEVNNGYPYLTNTPVSIDNSVKPQMNLVLKNYPNPFNNSTVISYQLANAGLVKLSVYNAKGEIVQNLVNASQTAGTHNIQFNANGLNSGVYFYRLESVEKSLVGKMLLVK